MFRFINRTEELGFLEQRYRSPKAELIVLYGRRRVGKSELVKHFIQNKNAIYFLATKTNSQDQLQKFLSRISSFFGDYTPQIDSWEETFKYLKKKISKERLILIIDEFPYLLEANPEIPSLFQLGWDEYFQQERILLILMGSSISMMETEVLGSKSPLYGRRTGQIKLAPFRFKDVLKFYPRSKLETIISFYAVVGNIPLYLSEFEEDKTVFENIYNKVLLKKELLNEEAEFLLREELRAPSTYQAILEAIATTSRVSDIAQKAHLELHNLDKYLKALLKLDLIYQEYPVTITKPKSKKTNYYIKDNFLDFWYRFCLPQASLMEENPRQLLVQFIQPNFNSWVGRKFEKVCQEYLWELSRAGKAPFSFTRLGREWGKIPKAAEDRNQYEIDICGINEKNKEILFGECKWQEDADALKLLSALKEKVGYVLWNNQTRKEFYVIFAKSFKHKLNENNVLCFDLNDLEKHL